MLSSSIAAAAATPGNLAAENDAWRKERLARLTGDEGWLTVVGLHWLEPGVNHIPSAPGLTFTRKDESVLLTADHPVMVNGKPVQKLALKPDDDKITIGSHTYFVIIRGEKVAIRERDTASEFRRKFKGLELYPFQPGYHLEAKWHPYAKPVTRRITTITNTIDEMVAPGQAEFVLAGQTYRLEPVIEEDHLFYIFKDRTAGKTTYGAGRFLTSPMPKDGKVTVDFNQAYNPPCAFTPYATCPLPLKENQLPIAIEAGEKAYHLD